ncbi:hypothetical protein CR513_28571, partial [Mucuna pruriens]
MVIVNFVLQGSTGIAVENFVMVAFHGRGRSDCGRGRSDRGTRRMSRNGKGGRDKTANISSSDIPSNERTGSQLILDEVSRVPGSSPTITPNHLHHQNRNTGQLIGKGHESRGLYYLSNNPSTLCFASISPKLLHNRLGHPSLAKL